MNVFVDNKSIYLPEFKAVGGIDVINPIDLARHDDANRGLGFFQNFDLHAGDLRLEDPLPWLSFGMAGIQVESGLRVSRRGVGGHV